MNAWKKEEVQLKKHFFEKISNISEKFEDYVIFSHNLVVFRLKLQIFYLFLLLYVTASML